MSVDSIKFHDLSNVFLSDLYLYTSKPYRKKTKRKQLSFVTSSLNLRVVIFSRNSEMPFNTSLSTVYHCRILSDQVYSSERTNF